MSQRDIERVLAGDSLYDELGDGDQAKHDCQYRFPPARSAVALTDLCQEPPLGLQELSVYRTGRIAAADRIELLEHFVHHPADAVRLT